jgi:hypothetical protein
MYFDAAVVVVPVVERMSDVVERDLRAEPMTCAGRPPRGTRPRSVTSTDWCLNNQKFPLNDFVVYLTLGEEYFRLSVSNFEFKNFEA